MVASAEPITEDHAVELIVCDESASANGGASASEEITPLLTQDMRPKINIFSVSYSGRKHRESEPKLWETEISPVTQFVQWVWSGSRYSGLLCMALSSTLYFAMEVLSDSFSGFALNQIFQAVKSSQMNCLSRDDQAQAIPLFEVALIRCTIILILSFLWLRRSGQPIFGPAHSRKLLFSRAFVGCLSMFSFVYSIQRLPLSQAILLSFTTPILASIVARIMLYEKLKISDIGGLACSFFGVLFIFRQILTPQGGLFTNGVATNVKVKGSHHILAVLVGLFSAIAGGISYCLVKAGAKASDQPIVTVLSFSILASPVAGLCTFAFEEFVMPGIYSVFLMVVLSVLGFLAEVLVARGLQLEKTSKVANVLYIEAALAQLWHIGSSSMAPSFGQLIGCILIVISVSYTMYIGPDKDVE